MPGYARPTATECRSSLTAAVFAKFSGALAIVSFERCGEIKGVFVADLATDFSHAFVGFS